VAGVKGDDKDVRGQTHHAQQSITDFQNKNPYWQDLFLDIPFSKKGFTSLNFCETGDSIVVLLP